MTVDLKVQDAITQWELEFGEGKTHCSIKLNYDLATHSNITCDAISFVAKVIEFLDYRIPANPEMEAFDILTSLYCQKEQRNKVKDTYGGKEIEVLTKAFWLVAPTVHHFSTNELVAKIRNSTSGAS